MDKLKDYLIAYDIRLLYNLNHPFKQLWSYHKLVALPSGSSLEAVFIKIYQNSYTIIKLHFRSRGKLVILRHKLHKYGPRSFFASSSGSSSPPPLPPPLPSSSLEGSGGVLWPGAYIWHSLLSVPLSHCQQQITKNKLKQRRAVSAV